MIHRSVVDYYLILLESKENKSYFICVNYYFSYFCFKGYPIMNEKSCYCENFALNKNIQCIEKDHYIKENHADVAGYSSESDSTILLIHHIK